MRSRTLPKKIGPKPKPLKWLWFIVLLMILPFAVMQIIARVYLAQGDRFFAEEDFDQAIAAYSTALNFQPNFATIYLKLGQALQQEQKYSQALEAYQKALLINPDFIKQTNLADHFNELGNIFQENEQITEAISAYEKAISIDPSLRDTHYNLGQIFLKENRLDDAINSFNTVIQLKPNDPQGYIGLGDAYKQQEQWERASKAYEQALKFQAFSPHVYQQLGKTYTELKQFNQATEMYNQAIILDPNNADNYNNLGQVLYEQNEIEKAIAAYEQSLVLNPDKGEIHKNLCYAYHRQKQYEKALNLCRKALTLDPTQGEAKFYVQEVERGLAIHKNPKILEYPERIPSPKNDPLIAVKRSIVKVIVQGNNYYGVGTGWVIKREGDRAFIVTNRHVIDHPQKKKNEPIKIAVELYSQPLPGEVTKRKKAKLINQTSEQEGLDLAVLEVKNLPSDIKALPLSSSLNTNQIPVKVIGHPITNKDWTIEKGTVASVSEQQLLISVLLASGNSGGPVLDSDNKVIGIIAQSGLYCPQSSYPDSLSFPLNDLGCGLAFPIELVQKKLKEWGINGI